MTDELSYEDVASPDAGVQPQEMSYEDATNNSAPQEMSYEDVAGPPTQQPQSSTFGAAARGFARSALPNTVGALAGLAVGAGTSEAATPLVGIPAGLATAGAVTYAAQKVQDKITDALGITDPAQEAADIQEHPVATTVGELGTAAITFGTGLEADLTRRALSGGLVGVVNVGQQLATTGSVDPEEALAAAGVGAALPNVRGWAQGAEGAAARAGAAWKGGKGTQVNPNAAQSPALEQADVTKTPPGTSPSRGTAFEQGQVPGTLSDQTENPASGMEAKAGGFSAGTGDLSRDQGKGSVPTGQEIPGAPSTVVDTPTPGIGGQDAAAALQTEQPPAPPPAAQAAIQGRPPAPPEAQQLAPQVPPEAQQPAPQPAETPPAIQKYHIASGANLDLDGNFYVDPRIPELSPSLKNSDGTPFNLHDALYQHELAETTAEVKDGKTYPQAHEENGLPTEKAYVESKGVPWKAYSDEIDHFVEQTEKPGDLPAPPPNISFHVDPEAAIGHHISKANEVADVEPGTQLPAATRAAMEGRPPPDTTGLDRRANTPALEPYTGPERRIGLPGAANPDEGILEASRVQREAAAGAQEKTKTGQVGEAFTPEKTIPEDLSIPAFLKRGQQPTTQAMSRFSMPKNLSDATDRLLGAFGMGKTATPSTQPPAAQAAINAGRAPMRQQNAIEKYISESGLGKMLSIRGGNTAGGNQAAATIRNAVGMARRNDEQFFARIEPLRKLANDKQFTDEDRQAFQIAMQQPGPMKGKLSFLQPLADAFNWDNKRQGDWLVKNNLLKPEDLAQNYWHQAWADEAKAKEFLQTFYSGMGSGGALKQKTFPTIMDGLNAGLKLKNVDPIAVATLDRTAKEAFIALNRILDEGKSQGYVHDAQQKGDVQLLGRQLNGKTMFAPADWARNFNNLYDPGWFHANVERAGLYDTARQLTNRVTALELAGPVFHGMAMATESVMSKIASAVGHATAGDFATAGKRLAQAPISPVSYYRSGKNALSEYIDGAHPELKEVVDLLTGAGATMKGMKHDPTYEFTGLESWFDAWRRGSLAMDLSRVRQNLTEPFTKANTLGGMAKAVAETPGRAGAEIYRAVGRTMKTIAQPLFEHYIPMIKNGVNVEHMSDWLRANPDATSEQSLAAARRFVDSTDNRLGEMNQDNIFLDKTLKQAAMLAMRSYSWNVGTVGEVAGGSLGAMMHPGRLSIKSKDYDPRAAYALALPIGVALMSSIYQYLKTGQLPSSAADLAAGRTGGTLKSGRPERGILPGYEKDVLGWFNDPSQEARNKLATAPRMVLETMTNKDWKDDPIWNANDPASKRLKQYFSYVGQSMGPIYAKQMLKGEKAGSKISATERALAIRPAPQFLSGSNPGQVKAIDQEWRRKLSHDKGL